MNQATFNLYKQYSCPNGAWTYPSAFRNAYMASKFMNGKKPSKFEWDYDRHGNKYTTFTEGQFSITVYAKYSEETPEYNGKWLTKYKPGCLVRRNANRNEYKYFLPDDSYDTHFAALRAIGKTRSEADVLARQYVLQTFKRAEKLLLGEIGIYYFKAVVSIDDVDLGSGSMGDAEGDDESEWEDCVRGAVSLALEEAESKIASLRKVICGEEAGC